MTVTKHPGRKLNRARILLLADEGKTDEAIEEVLHIGFSSLLWGGVT